ncbi:MAG: hypothetical protein H0Z29_03690 [Candidatus Marinimicrobia bacterium]|nr:hypothetical protein [Candidatus Neomarinimicrobiota bacterium]
MKLIIATPYKKIELEDIEYVRLLTLDGYMGIMKNHIPAIVYLEPGDIKYKKNGKSFFLWCPGGFAEITGTDVLITTESTESPGEINIKETKKEVDNIYKKVKTYGSLAGFVLAGIDLKRSVNKLKFADRFRKK